MKNKENKLDKKENEEETTSKDDLDKKSNSKKKVDEEKIKLKRKRRFFKNNKEPKDIPLIKSVAYLFIWAIILNLIIETLARKWFGGLSFMIHSPVIFLYNAMLIFMTLSISLLFRRRKFFYILISSIWIAIGVTNGIILMERMTPFTVKDLSAINDAATILTNYFSTMQLVSIAGAIVIGVIAIVVLWIKAPKYVVKGKMKQNLIAVLLIIITTLGVGFGLVLIKQ